MDDLAAFEMPSMVIPHSTSSVAGTGGSMQGGPYVCILEQPAQRALRFRYECEGRSAGSIPGASSSTQTKTHPTIQIMNYTGSAVVVVSCVTRDGPPYKPHPHNLVGREGCKRGVCTLVINSPDMVCSFTSLGIQCVKKKDIDESLRLRETIKVDPYKTGFAHRNQANNIDLNVVRFCFQVFLEGPDKDKYTVPLPPVVSEPIYDKKALSELIITKLSHHSAPVSGGSEIILLCDRITKDDVQICFYQEHQGQCVWDDYGDFQPSDVHKQFAICFRTPRYVDQTITQPINVNIQLRRISDGTVSEPRPFQFTPLGDPEGLRHKRQKIDEGCLDRYLREEMPVIGAFGLAGDGARMARVIRQPIRTSRIKTEPECNNLLPMRARYSNSPSTSPFNIPSTHLLEGAASAIHHSKLDYASPNIPQSSGHTVRPDILPPPPLRSVGHSVSGSNGSHHHNSEQMDTNMQETLEKFDSLDLGIDYKELHDLMGTSNLDENLTLNLSASIFDSGNLNGNNNLANTTIHNTTTPNTEVTTTSTEENLQQISRLHTEISALNNLCGVVKPSH